MSKAFSSRMIKTVCRWHCSTSLPGLSSWWPPFCSWLPCIWLFLDIHLNGIIQCLFFVTGLFHLESHPEVYACCCQWQNFLPFQRLMKILLNLHTTCSLSIHLCMDIGAVSRCGLLWIMRHDHASAVISSRSWFYFCVICAQSAVAGSYSNSAYNSLRNHNTVLHNGCFIWHSLQKPLFRHMVCEYFFTFSWCLFILLIVEGTLLSPSCWLGIHLEDHLAISVCLFRALYSFPLIFVPVFLC